MQGKRYACDSNRREPGPGRRDPELTSGMHVLLVGLAAAPPYCCDGLNPK